MGSDFVFASCYKQDKKAPALETIAVMKPGVMVWMGDTIYGDTEDMEALREEYDELARHPSFLKIRESSEVIGTWDDHDYGVNDGGKEYPKRAESQQVLLDFYEVPEESPRRDREGVYSTSVHGEEGKQVRVILLDTRYHRDEKGSNGTILGEEQWRWLERTLRESEAEAHVIVSSIQVIPNEHRFEKWGEFEDERRRFFELLADEEIPPVFIMSGDRHRGEITLNTDLTGYPLYEITASSLNRGYFGKKEDPNSERVGEQIHEPNFAGVDFQWENEGAPRVTVTLFDAQGRVLESVEWDLKR